MFESTQKRLWQNEKGRPLSINVLIRECLLDNYFMGDKDILENGYITEEDINNRMIECLCDEEF